MSDVLPSIISVVFGLIGVFIGYRLNLKKDKRKEYLSEIIPLRQKFIQVKDHMKGEKVIFPDIGYCDMNRLEATQPKTYKNIKAYYDTFDRNKREMVDVCEGGLIRYREKPKQQLLDATENILRTLKV